jgi:tetratricopeptide (TPR) repeat protein
MTADTCPFVSKEFKKKVCPTCAIPKKAKELPIETVMTECMSRIERQLDSAVINEKAGEIIPSELYKLKRVTTTEEDHPLESLVHRKKTVEILKKIKSLYHPKTPNEQVKYFLDFGDGLYNLGEYDEALSLYDSANKLNPNEKRSWNNIGVALVRLGKLKEAIKYYDKALELDPKFGMAWFNRGKALFKLGMEKKALESFQNATKHSPKNKSAWNNLGVTLRHMGKFKESIKCYDEAIKIHSSYPWAWHNKGVALMDLKRYKEAVRCFDSALRIDPNYSPARRRKQEVLRHLLK